MPKDTMQAQQLNQMPKSAMNQQAMPQNLLSANDMPWFTAGPELYGRLRGFGSPLDMEVDWDMEGLTLPVDADTYQFPFDEIVTKKVEAIMDIPDQVLLDSPYGPQEVEMFNIPPRTEPAPIFMGDEFYNPWDPEFMSYGMEALNEPEKFSEEEEFDEEELHQAKVDEIKDKIAKKLNNVKEQGEVHYINALNK